MALTREQLLAPRNAAREKIRLPSVGDDVWIRMMTAGERRDFLFEGHELDKGKEGESWRTYPERLLVRALSDEDGKPLFQPGEEDLVRAMDGLDIDVAFEAACRVNKVGHHGIGAEAGKSEGTPSDEPSSGSASPSASPA